MEKFKVTDMVITDEDFGFLVGEFSYSIYLLLMYLCLSFNRFLTEKFKFNARFYFISFVVSLFCVKEFKLFYVILYSCLCLNAIIQNKKHTIMLKEALIFSNALILSKVTNKLFFNLSEAFFTFISAITFFCFYNIKIKKPKEVEFEIYEIDNLTNDKRKAA